MVIVTILALMAILAEKYAYQNGQSYDQFMCLSKEWHNPELYEVDLYPNWSKSYGLYSMLHRKEATQAMTKVYALCKLPSRSFTNIFAYD